jgi:hypothetical protein
MAAADHDHPVFSTETQGKYSIFREARTLNGRLPNYQGTYDRLAAPKAGVDTARFRGNAAMTNQWINDVSAET